MTDAELCARVAMRVFGLGYNIAMGRFTSRRTNGSPRWVDDGGLRGILGQVWYTRLELRGQDFDYLAVKTALQGIAPDEGGQV